MYGDAWQQAETISQNFVLSAGIVLSSVHLRLGYTTRHHQRPFSSLDAYRHLDPDAPKRLRYAHANNR